MKKLFLSLCALLGAATMITSCSDDNQLALTDDGNVTFNVSVPGSIASRAFADGTTAQNNVAYYVYDAANGSDAEPVLTGLVPMNSLKGTVTLGLAIGHNYDVVFLATSTAAPYTYSTTDRNL
ncbi:MAG: hypothetical protein K2L73_01405, partial [Muribaculaceae bacterium]|nr:hypothetical protein [Muribaculaceae bacterium]